MLKIIQPAKPAKAAGIRAFHYGAFNDAVTQLSSAKEDSPVDECISFFLAASLQEVGRKEEALKEFQRCADINPEYSMTSGAGLYLTRRRRVREGAPYEDGWLTFLDLVLDSGLFKLPALEARSGKSAEQAFLPIPPRIMQYWDSAKIPPDVADIMSECRGQNRDLEYTRLSEDDAKEFILNEFGTDILAVYEACFHVSAKSDFIRFAYLYKLGGFYVDADELCVRSFSKYFRRPEIYDAYSYSRALTSCVNTWFIGTIPGSRVVENSLENCIQNIAATKSHGVLSNAWVLTGPGALSFAFLDNLCNYFSWKNSSPIEHTIFIKESDYREFFHSATELEYKSTEKGNWRLHKG